MRCAQLDEGVFRTLATDPQARIRVLRLPAAAPVARAAEGSAFTEKALEEHLEAHWQDTPFARDGVELSRRWWVFELKRGRSPDVVVGQVSRYIGWLHEERSGRGESAVGAIIVRKADPKLRHAVKANERLSLWEFDDQLDVRRVA